MDTKAFYKELIEVLKQEELPEKKLNRIKRDFCKKYDTKFIPTNIQILLNASEKELLKLRWMQTKPTRSISGVSVVALMTKPMLCPHVAGVIGGVGKGKKVGPCSFCPGGPKSVFGDTPQSYTGKEPSTMRGVRNLFDSYLETFNRLEQYVVLGHNYDKVELIVMGGTFTAFPKEYQEEFVKYAFKALNDFSELFFVGNKFDLIKFRKFFLLPGTVGDPIRTKKIQAKLLKLKNKVVKDKKGKITSGEVSLEKEQIRNEKAKIRCVGLTLETRPDCLSLKDAKEMLRLGATRVEIGVQTVYDKVLERVNRGHSVQDSIDATKLLKDLAFKINYHVMPGLPDVSYDDDLKALRQYFTDERFRPDMLKIYPCLVMKGTKLFDEWKKGKFDPLTTDKAAKLIAEFKKDVPEYVRIMRVQRDIPTYMTEAGVDRTNLRQYIDKHKHNCRCIRCREVGHVMKKTGRKPEKVELIEREYDASDGVEYFLSFEDKKNDILLGFCRLRIPSKDSAGLRKEITAKSAFVRELHVFGEAVEIGSKDGKGKSGKDEDMKTQHKGLGKKLIAKAEQIAKKNGKDKMIIISGVGVREYYKRLGYKKEGVYMVKKV